jgi:hypothetical protein
MGFNHSMIFRDCPRCGLRDAQFHAMSTNVGALSNDDAKRRFWAIVTCPRCAGAVLLETDNPESQPGRELSAMPEDSAASLKVSGLPDDVRRYYEQAVRVLGAGVPSSAAVELRRTLEAASTQKGSDSGTLFQRIEALIENGDLTNHFKPVLHHIRKVGNAGAHAGEDEVTEDEARRALRFTTAVLRDLFEIPHQLDELGAEDGEQ